MNGRPRFYDPKKPLVFKKIFGREGISTPIKINFLNAALELKGKNKISDLRFIHPYLTPAIEAKNAGLVDLLVYDNNEKKYIVELQMTAIRRRRA